MNLRFTIYDLQLGSVPATGAVFRALAENNPEAQP